MRAIAAPSISTIRLHPTISRKLDEQPNQRSLLSAILTLLLRPLLLLPPLPPPTAARLVLQQETLPGVGGGGVGSSKNPCRGLPPRSKSWPLTVVGFVDKSHVSASMSAFLRDESLECRSALQLPPSDLDHLTRVLAPAASVASVSIAYDLARVEPCLDLQPLSHALAMPSALAPAHLHTFRAWYRNRIPIRMTAQQDTFNRRALITLAGDAAGTRTARIVFDDID